MTGLVLHVITGLGTGGAEAQLAALVAADHADGRPAAVVSLTPGGGHRDRLLAAGIDVSDLGMRRGRPSPIALLRLAGMIRRLKPVVVQSWLYHADLMAVAALKLSGRRRKTRLYWNLRCSDMDTARYGRGLRTTIAGCVALSSVPDAVIANAETGVEVHRGLGYRPKRFLVIDNGIDTARYRPDPEARTAIRSQLGIADETPVLALVARCDAMKDHETFLRAFDRLSGVEALLVGAGTEALPAKPGLHRLGRRDDVPALLASADVIVNSSAFGEGFSNAIAEGMAAGLPAVATDVGDARRIVGAAGRIVRPGDPVALADAIAGVFADDRQSLGQSARARIETHFSMDRMIAAYRALYDQAAP
ncbi:MAG: group 1 glycosyl transferase [Rhodospirillaceae bacterium]|nr:group 1 glycosyl transferase [Rhodospirillaceae bacterium]